MEIQRDDGTTLRISARWCSWCWEISVERRAPRGKVWRNVLGNKRFANGPFSSDEDILKHVSKQEIDEEIAEQTLRIKLGPRRYS